jgi:hypothetical protein
MIAGLLRGPSGAGTHELVVRAGLRYEHPWPRAVVAVAPLVPLTEDAVLDLYGSSHHPVLSYAAGIFPGRHDFTIPCLFKKDGSIMVTLRAYESRKDYFGAAVLLVCV